MALNVFGQTRSGDEIIQLAVRLGLLAFLLFWCFVLVRPFIPILAWSVVLTVALYPLYEWLSVHLGGRPRLAAAIVTLVNLAIVIGPVTWLGVGLVDGLQTLAAQLSAGTLAIPSPPEGVKSWPIVGARDFQPLGPCLDKSAGSAARGGAAVETVGGSRALLCRQRGPWNAEICAGGGAVRLPVPRWSARRCGNEKSFRHGWWRNEVRISSGSPGRPYVRCPKASSALPCCNRCSPESD